MSRHPDPDFVFKLKSLLHDYAAEVEKSSLRPASKSYYIDFADCFVSWIAGSFNPGSMGERAPRKRRKRAVVGDCYCGHPFETHLFPGTELIGDCLECPCSLYDPPEGLANIALHPLYEVDTAMYRLLSCRRCHHYSVRVDGVCESCEWDNDAQAEIADSRPGYCLMSSDMQHDVPAVTANVPGLYCRFCGRKVRSMEDLVRGAQRSKH